MEAVDAAVEAFGRPAAAIVAPPKPDAPEGPNA
jgi:hypothetical protein